MSANKPASPTAGASLADDLHQAGGLLASIYGKAFPETNLVLLFLAAIWIAVERLRQAVQASAQVDDWKSSNAATEAKARELGISAARPGESSVDFQFRVAQEQKQRGEQ